MSGSLATTISESMMTGAASNLGGLVLGRILAEAGADFSGQAEMSHKLDRILAELADLRTAVDNLAKDLKTAAANQAYDLAASGVLGLISVNATLNREFRSLLTAKPDEQLSIKQSITAEFAKLPTGLATWDECLRGASGQTGLIEGWAWKIRMKCADWFSPRSAAAIQSHWDYFDAQQALTVAYLVEFHNQRKERTMARSVLETWSQNRQLQLRMLRGTSRHEEKVIDSWADVDIEPDKELLIDLGASNVQVKNPDPTPLTVVVPNWATMPLSSLPLNTAIHISSSTMWCLEIGEEVSANSIETYGDKKIPFHAIYPSVGDITGIHDGWYLPSAEKVRGTLFTRAGINEVSEFYDGLSSLGFTFAPHGPARINLWTLNYDRAFIEHHPIGASDQVTSYRGSIKQPGGWDWHWGELDSMGNVLAVRHVDSSEMTRYLP
jgi:hypothetical protein